MKIATGRDRPSIHVSRQNGRAVIIAQERPNGQMGYVRVVLDISELRAVADALHDYADVAEQAAFEELIRSITT